MLLVARFFLATSLETWDVLLLAAAIIPALIMHKVHKFRTLNQKLASDIRKQHPSITHPSQWKLLPTVAGICLCSLIALVAAWRCWGWAGLTKSGDRATASLAIVGGLGLIVSLVVAYRKQSSTERTESSRQINAAMQLLGEDLPTKRNAGVFALLDIGDRNQEVRQQIVNQLCRYLRTRRKDDASVEAAIISELSQRLGHYGYPHWEDMDLDLHGATITEPFDISNAHIFSINCEKTQFRAAFVMENANIKGTALFMEAEFEAPVNITFTTFEGDANFRNIAFHDSTSFGYSNFMKDTYFYSSRFHDPVTFQYVSFTGRANFNSITIYSSIDLSTAVFKRKGSFLNIRCNNPVAETEVTNLRRKLRHPPSNTSPVAED
ncbi:MAG: pentapeptide repeat-containing protein [Bifidobacterium crudilactis]|uniref:pentapeptide repeat-containing protein n=1 Tax=Bifidobacterium crudilactis TaxID=327277 RepID=UPI0026476CC9|nr:pentapeptide repeat-containing protein [Bifidobacterium crudilactis]MDN5973327.1 pentapeptide repeat-containing protein [Bifidobacterium crudilactis]MDN6522915.1 pentapeptide repeat-containing protein [Bifidobacterium crudilactis]MDN6655055.1 pentapeptide repeat-containing protein [Bifidobacterium crudilactis]MDN6683695.1 pentapeptide repeat-containing protein [Bifidobacterium crudilactis]MDN6773290.1 pentapeptide repeat-containing protein [Bifidobacterium crudilactis]